MEIQCLSPVKCRYLYYNQRLLDVLCEWKFSACHQWNVVIYVTPSTDVAKLNTPGTVVKHV